MSASFESLGVGSGSAVATSAALIWLWRDGCSLIAKFVTTARYNSYFAANSRKSRIFADISRSFAAWIVIITPLLSEYAAFPALALAGVLESVASVAAGSAAVVFRKHQACASNIVDVKAKDANQKRFVSLLSVAIGAISPLPRSRSASLFASAILTAFNLFSSWRMVFCLKFRSLSLQRTAILCAHFKRIARASQTTCALMPRDVAKAESFFGWPSHLPRIRLDVSLFGEHVDPAGAPRRAQQSGLGGRGLPGVNLTKRGFETCLLEAVVAELIGASHVESWAKWSRKCGWDVDGGLICAHEDFLKHEK
eukprot:Plantae.Rhodophyta-Hildenbrandia_rubra.ctg25136.p1 GENE.Plantae.Rhodophyta-Hildenbrandia_rubra.ctg25136~~Plantae.Rhodophyta-Hildenbrandia_rubra.ctg25136.p1  ORF type:complete len:326 (-),score=27.41 Plantae.Rhodophyta-Hildenbrandia_rubra.ctg25136:217-1146(-)